jgi:hypothetical protein
MSNMYSKLIQKEKKVIFEINDWVLVHMSCPVHGSVRFSLNHKNQPNLVTQIFKNSNRTEPNSGSNRAGSVRFG